MPLFAHPTSERRFRPHSGRIGHRVGDAGEATCATVSRDLAAIGAVRGPGGYSLPGGFTLRPPCLGPLWKPHCNATSSGARLRGPWWCCAPPRGTLRCWPASSTPRPPKAWSAASPVTTPFSLPPPPPPRPSLWCVPLTPCKKAWPYEHALPRNPRLGLDERARSDAAARQRTQRHPAAAAAGRQVDRAAFLQPFPAHPNIV